MKWLLADLLHNFVLCDEQVTINNITLNSQDVTKGSLFIALQGSKKHGLAYAQEAIKLGAVAIVWESVNSDEKASVQGYLNDLNQSIICIEMKELSAKLGYIADRFFAHPSSKMNIIAVTGTDGKTSVSHLIAQALNACDQKTGIIGTIGVGQPDQLVASSVTTPDVITVHRLLARFVKEGYRTVAMEVSSHALSQHRIVGVALDIAVLTNVTRDHLDYHGTLEAYISAKKKLFTEFAPSTVVLNLDDDFGIDLANKMDTKKQTVVGYQSGINPSSTKALKQTLSMHFKVQDSQFDRHGMTASVRVNQKTLLLQSQLLGDFNLSNLLAVMAVLRVLRIDDDQIIKAIQQLTAVPGRMERIEGKDGVLIVVDYAHTPAALESALKAMSRHTSYRLLCVFGCGGDRDKGKRPLMAKVAENNSQLVVLTDDNPRFESPFMIMHDIIEGFETPEFVAIEHDRAKAIRYALEKTELGDALLIAGKGHENYQLVEGEKFAFDDRKEALKVIKEITL